jgi:hypothetical protein
MLWSFNSAAACVACGSRDRETCVMAYQVIASVTSVPSLTCYNPLRGLPGALYSHSLSPSFQMHFTAIFGFAVLLAGQGMVRYWPQAKPTH